MKTDDKKVEHAGEEIYTAPALTKHDALHGLTGFSQIPGTNIQ